MTTQIPPKLPRGPKQSQEMREALRLVAFGLTHQEAAIRAGVSRDGLQRALRKIKLEQSNKPVDM